MSGGGELRVVSPAWLSTTHPLALHPHTTRPPAVLGPSEYMTTASTNVTFYVNTTPSTFDEAQYACRVNGGNLAVYTSQEEQQVGAAGHDWRRQDWPAARRMLSRACYPACLSCL
jgi:hypothetical protein